STGMAGGGGTSGVAGTTGVAGTGGVTGTGGTGGTRICLALCTVGRMCCDGACVNMQNDPFNCGKCGNICPPTTPYCRDGTCGRPECAIDACLGTTTCCGSTCCAAGQICCEDQGPISRLPTCYTPTKDQPTCPQGCAPECRSDRNQKKNITPADTQLILDKVARLPISTWTYNEEPNAVRHLGPMAQDFRASFGLGADDRTYNSVDAHGVALAAIQALERVVAAQEKRIEKLERENRRLSRRR
ncbi:MAG TPA: tail fiber domain-containing protein, partial [Polyangia bacterium]|nr:tail fiber domain-containing protein [Polyangia bacterium]